jgi:hypothetical protein
MNLSFRHRTGLFFTGLIIGAPLLGGGVVHAGTATITFSGQPLLGLSTLSCSSTPSRTGLVVAPGTVVDFVNRTGKPATLWAGDAQKDLPDKSLVPVTFTQGPATITIQMVPKCSLDLGKHISMTVSVASPRSGSPKPSTAPSPSPGGTGATMPRTDPGKAGSSSGSKHTAAPTDSVTPTPEPTQSTSAAGATSTNSDDNDPFQAAPASDAAVQPVFGTAVGPASPHSASGLLTLVATVGVVGVSVAAIRAILAQRASRALAA